MRLVAGSFRGLATTGLYLHDCSLRLLAPTVLQPLNSTVKYLWLNGNELVTLDQDLESMFSVLEHLRLGQNPLRCDCSAVWLKRLYDSRRQVFRGAAAPSCHSPDRLRGRAFNETTLDQFLCRAPQLTRVELAANSTAGRLVCAAAGEPIPTIYWIQPSGHTTRYIHRHTAADIQKPLDASAETGENEGALLIESLNASANRLLAGMYICIANNDAGNVTLTINVPASTPPSDPQVYLTSNTSAAAGAAVQSTSTDQSVDRWQDDDDTVMSSKSLSTSTAAVKAIENDAVITDTRGQSFTLSEIVVAVVITHVVTLLCYMMLAALCYWRHCAAAAASARHHQFTRSSYMYRPSKSTSQRHRHRPTTLCSSASTLYTAATSSALHQSTASRAASPQHQLAVPAVFLNGIDQPHREFFFETAAAAAAATYSYGDEYRTDELTR